MSGVERDTRYELNPEDWLAAERLFFRGHLSRPVVWLAFALFGLIAILALVADGWDPVGRIMVGGISLAILAFAPIRYWLLMGREAHKLYAHRKAFKVETRMVWSENGLMIANAATDGVMLPWTHYRKWREDDKIVLIHEAELLYEIVPRRVLTAAQLDDLRACARNGGVKGA